MKYLIAEDFSGQPVPFIFPDRVTHADMREQLPYTRILSAGYVTYENGAFVCSGGDAELDIFFNPKDTDIISACFAPKAAEKPC